MRLKMNSSSSNGGKKTQQSTAEQNEYKPQNKDSPLHKLRVITSSSVGLTWSEDLSRAWSVALDWVCLESYN